MLAPGRDALGEDDSVDGSRRSLAGLVCDATRMDVEHLAQQLSRYASLRDGRLSLVVRVGPARDLYFRFSESPADPAPMLTWQARSGAVGSAETQELGWLARMDFRRDHAGLSARVVGMPLTIEDARVIAGLAAFLLEHAYRMPEDAVVSVALETA